MLGLISVLGGQSFVMTGAAIQEMYDQLNRIFRLWIAAGLDVKPKLHMLMHLADRAQRQGNPVCYATWGDESLNRVLGQLGRAAHRTVWEARVLAMFEQRQEHEQAPKRQRS